MGRNPPQLIAGVLKVRSWKTNLVIAGIAVAERDSFAISGSCCVARCLARAPWGFMSWRVSCATEVRRSCSRLGGSAGALTSSRDRLPFHQATAVVFVARSAAGDRGGLSGALASSSAGRQDWLAIGVNGGAAGGDPCVDQWSWRRFASEKRQMRTLLVQQPSFCCGFWKWPHRGGGVPGCLRAWRGLDRRPFPRRCPWLEWTRQVTAADWRSRGLHQRHQGKDVTGLVGLLNTRERWKPLNRTRYSAGALKG